MSNSEIDKALAKGLDEDGLIRLKSVELSIKYMKDKTVNDPEYMAKQCEKIYNFLTNKQTK